MLRDLQEALERADLSDQTRAKIRNVVTVLEGDPQARLVSFWLEGDEPFAVISFGDVDSADLIAYVLHGIATDLERLPVWADAAQRICADVIRSCAARGIPRSIATIVWFGWDSGSHVTALATKHATIGAGRLAVELDRTADRNADAHIAVVAYSYAVTLMGEMFTLNIAEKVRTIVTIASAGVTQGAGTAIEEAIADGEVVFYATEGSADGIARLGRLGQHPVDPCDLDGVIVYDSDGGDAPGIDGGTVIGVGVEGHASQTSIDDDGTSHAGYFDGQGQGYLTMIARLADAATQ